MDMPEQSSLPSPSALNAWEHHSPIPRRRPAVQHLGNAPSGAGGGAFGKAGGGKELRFGDFGIGRESFLPEPPEHETGDVISRKLPVIQKNAVEDGCVLRRDRCLLAQFAQRRLGEAFAPLHPATWQKPAGGVGMAHQQHFARVTFQLQRAGTQRHAAPLAVDGVDHRFRRLIEQAFQKIRHGSG